MTPTVPTTVTPTKVGQSVRFTSYGGNVRMWHMEGTDATVVRFTSAGNPVIRFTNNAYLSNVGSSGQHEVVDTLGCARLLDDDGKLVWDEVQS